MGGPWGFGGLDSWALRFLIGTLSDVFFSVVPRLAAVDHLPEGRDRQEQSVDVRLDLQKVLEPLGELDRNLDNLRDAEALALALGDQQRLGWVAAYRSADPGAGPTPRRPSNSRSAPSASPAPSTTASWSAMARTVWPTPPTRWAITVERSELYERVAESGERLEFGGEGLPLLVLAKHWLAWCLAQLGRFPEGLTRAEQSLRIAESMDHPYSLVVGHRAIGFVTLVKGSAGHGHPSLEPALAICQSASLSVVFDGTASALGYAYALAGRLADGIALLDQAVQHAASTGTSYHSLFLSRLSEAYSMAGRTDEALAVAGGRSP